mmetsp:Transcript_28174/g.90060  ORF Transcript_28174/g.90060 Transcript_28174/m.90060 type:complete len:203 (-) Transcript_28174:1280-1888(-)
MPVPGATSSGGSPSLASPPSSSASSASLAPSSSSPPAPAPAPSAAGCCGCDGACGAAAGCSSGGAPGQLNDFLSVAALALPAASPPAPPLAPAAGCSKLNPCAGFSGARSFCAFSRRSERASWMLCTDVILCATCTCLLLDVWKSMWPTKLCSLRRSSTRATRQRFGPKSWKPPDQNSTLPLGHHQVFVSSSLSGGRKPRGQ